MFSLFGKAIGATKGVANDMAGYLDDASDAVGGLGGGAGDAADGLGSAGKAAKELKKQLTVLPFDELNQLAKDTESASSGGGGGGGAGGGGGGIGGLGDLGIEDWGTGLNIDDSPVVQAINRWAARIREAFQKHQWANMGRIIAEGINKGFKYIYDVLDWNKIKPKVVDGFIVPFQTVINNMMRYIDWELIGATFARGLNVIVYTLRAWITGFEWRNYGTYLARGMNSMIGDIDADALGRLIADKFKIAWEFFGGWVRKFDFAQFGRQLKKLVLGALDELDFSDMGESLGLFVTGVANTISEFLRDGEVQKKVTKALTDFANGFIKGFDGEDVRDALKLLADTIGGILGDTLKGIDKDDLAADLKSVLEGLPWETVFNGLGAIVGGKLALQFFGTAFKNRASAILASQFPSLFGSGAGATGGVSGATAGAGAVAGASGLSLGTIVGTTLAIGAVTIAGIELGKYIKDHGWGQLDTEGNKQRAAQTTAEGQTKNQQALDKAGMNGAGYNTSIQTVPNQPAPQAPTGGATTNTVTTVMKGILDPTFKAAQEGVVQLGKNPTFTKTMYGKDGGKFQMFCEWLHDTGSYSTNKLIKATDKGNLVKYHGYQIDQGSYLTTKQMKAADKGNFILYRKYLTDKGNYLATKYHKASDKGSFVTYRKYQTDQGHYSAYKWQYGVDKSKFSLFHGYQTDQGHYDSTKWFYAKDKGDFVNFTDNYKGIGDKTVTLTIDIDTTVDQVVATFANAPSQVLANIVKKRFNALGGLFTGPLGFQVFGEAGDEAAIPLERKSTMKKIASAIVNSGGMSASNSDDIADAIAMRVLPVMAEMVNRASNRPVNVNATLYTENNEVLARAVNKGNRSLDKRYNPVSQFSY